MKLTDTSGHGSNSGDFLVFISLYQPPFREPHSELNLYLYSIFSINRNASEDLIMSTSQESNALINQVH